MKQKQKIKVAKMPSRNAIKWGIFAFVVPIVLMCSFAQGIFMLAVQLEGAFPSLAELSRNPQTFYAGLAILFCFTIPINLVIGGVFIHMLYRILNLHDPTKKQKRKQKRQPID